jgi:hypothetical protein
VKHEPDHSVLCAAGTQVRYTTGAMGTTGQNEYPPCHPAIRDAAEPASTPAVTPTTTAAPARPAGSHKSRSVNCGNTPALRNKSLWVSDPRPIAEGRRSPRYWPTLDSLLDGFTRTLRPVSSALRARTANSSRCALMAGPEVPETHSACSRAEPWRRLGPCGGRGGHWRVGLFLCGPAEAARHSSCIRRATATSRASVAPAWPEHRGRAEYRG